MSTLSIGASLLLPPLRERTELLHSLLPQGPESWDSLSKGQVHTFSSILYIQMIIHGHSGILGATVDKKKK